MTKRNILIAAIAAIVFFLWVNRGMSKGGKVYHTEKLIGAAPTLHAFFDWWSVNGPFPIVITSGGRSESEQMALYAQGRTTPGNIVTEAASTRSSAHGYKTDGYFHAVDAAPCEVVAGIVTKVLYPENFQGSERIAIEDKFNLYGSLIQAHNLTWGGNFTNRYDGPHVETLNWKAVS